MVAAVVERMKTANVKKAAYIGFSDSWGDLVYDATMKNVAGSTIEVVTNERYARADTSVTGQTLKIIAARPDAVITGGSGTPGALPYLALAERGYKGGLYGTHALINPDFVRVGGTAVEGVICPTGPVVVAEQLPDSNVTKKVSLAFRDAYQKANNAPTTDAFSAYSFDGWLVLVDAAKRALAQGAAGHARVSPGVQGGHGHHQRSGRHPWRLQLQAGQLFRRRRARPRAGEARARQVEAAAVSRPSPVICER